MHDDPIYRQRLTTLQQHLLNGVPFLKWTYQRVGRWDATNTTLVCGCAMAEASCLFRDANGELYRLVGVVADRPGQPSLFHQGDWDAMEAEICAWFGLTKQEFNFLFIPVIGGEDATKGCWFTEGAQPIDIAGGIQHLLDGLELPVRDNDELALLEHSQEEDLSNQL